MRLTTALVEEVPVKWMDRPSATEMERVRASEMDRQTKCHKMKMPLRLIKFNNKF